MRGVREDHCLVGEDLVHQVLVALDERRLFRRVELARDRFRFAVFHAQAMQQRDQAGPGLVLDATLSRDPCANLAGRAWQSRAHPRFQLILLLHRQPAAATLMVEGHQPLDPVLQIKLMPLADRIAVE
jgi:hypothetical protein